jgi:hypothetical protein
MSTTGFSHDKDESVGSKSELDEPRWSIISFEKHEAVGLAYDIAVRKLNDLGSQGIPGLCIVTDAAAERVGRSRRQ